MRKSKFTKQQRLEVLAKHDGGTSVADLSRELQISPATFYKWKKKHTTEEDDTQRRLKELESENKRLKKIYAGVSIDHDILKQGYGMLKKWQAQERRQEQMIDLVRSCHGSSERRSCRVLGFRRATYRGRKAGHRPEVADEELAKLLRRTATDERYLSWGFWKIFHYLRNQGKLSDNHKRVYRIWRGEGLNLRRPPRRKRLLREYRDLISPDGVN